MRRAKVFYRDQLAGILEELADGYHFTYIAEYLNSDNARPVSLTLPLRPEHYQSTTMFSFFDGLIPEGWLLNIAEQNWKLDRRDRMGLLLACCQDCIGAVRLIDYSDEG
ncbi:MAG: HipA N-terminal domain-containing protein [Candidatus Marinimicrobia bacterium]|nr:HipA N-terminal domain-containing protein [Candidatus Neomarinimicrobiota bacterium]